MTLRAGVGTSSNRNSQRAVEEAIALARQQAGITEAQLVLLFATVGHDQQAVLSAARNLTGGAALAGCSAEGIISSAGSNETPFAVVAAVLASDELRFEVVSARGLDKSARAVGEDLGRSLHPLVKGDAIALLAFPDGLTLNFDEWSRGLASTMGGDKSIPMFGGTSADDWAMKQTFQYCNDEVLSNGVVAVLISGRGKLAFGVNHGCVPIGQQRTITKSKGNVIYEIDGRRALDVMSEYLDVQEREDWGRAVMNLTLGFKAPDALQQGDEFIIRFCPRKDDAEGSISLYTDVQEGSSVWLTRRDYEKVSRGLTVVADQLSDQLGSERPNFVMQFDCAGRGKAIFSDDERQSLVKQLRDRIGADVPWIGFYSYGEIGPIAGRTWFHNYTAVVAALV